MDSVHYYIVPRHKDLLLLEKTTGAQAIYFQLLTSSDALNSTHIEGSNLCFSRAYVVSSLSCGFLALFSRVFLLSGNEESLQNNHSKVLEWGTNDLFEKTKP